MFLVMMICRLRLTVRRHWVEMMGARNFGIVKKKAAGFVSMISAWQCRKCELQLLCVSRSQSSVLSLAVTQACLCIRSAQGQGRQVHLALFSWACTSPSTVFYSGQICHSCLLSVFNSPRATLWSSQHCCLVSSWFLTCSRPCCASAGALIHPDLCCVLTQALTGLWLVLFKPQCFSSCQSSIPNLPVIALHIGYAV